MESSAGRTGSRLGGGLALALLAATACEREAPVVPPSGAVEVEVAEAEAETEVETETEAKPEQFVLVRWDAEFYRGSLTGMQARAFHYPYPTEDWRWGPPPGPGPAVIPELEIRGFSFRLLGESEDFVEIETLVHERFAHCHDPLPGFDELRLRLLVRREELLVVVREPVTLEYADGSAVRLQQGQGVLPLGDGAYAVLADPYPHLLAGEAGGQALRVELDDSQVGDRWSVPSDTRGNQPGPEWGDCAFGSEHASASAEPEWLATQGAGCVLRKWQQTRAGQPEPWYSVDDGRVFAGRIVDAEARELGDLRRFELGCVGLDVHVEQRELRRPLAKLELERPAPGRIFNPRMDREFGPGVVLEHRSSTGGPSPSPVYWSDGPLAGAAFERIRVLETWTLRYLDVPRGGHRCLLLPLRPDAPQLYARGRTREGPAIELCIDDYVFDMSELDEPARGLLRVEQRLEPHPYLAPR